MINVDLFRAMYPETLEVQPHELICAVWRATYPGGRYFTGYILVPRNFFESERRLTEVRLECKALTNFFWRMDDRTVGDVYQQCCGPDLEKRLGLEILESLGIRHDPDLQAYVDGELRHEWEHPERRPAPVKKPVVWDRCGSFAEFLMLDREEPVLPRTEAKRSGT